MGHISSFCSSLRPTGLPRPHSARATQKDRGQEHRVLQVGVQPRRKTARSTPGMGRATLAQRQPHRSQPASQQLHGYTLQGTHGGRASCRSDPFFFKASLGKLDLSKDLREVRKLACSAARGGVFQAEGRLIASANALPARSGAGGCRHGRRTEVWEALEAAGPAGHWQEVGSHSQGKGKVPQGPEQRGTRSDFSCNCCVGTDCRADDNRRRRARSEALQPAPRL